MVAQTRSHGRVVALPTRHTPAVQLMADLRGTRLVLMCTRTRHGEGHVRSAWLREELGGTRIGLWGLRMGAGRRHDNARGRGREIREGRAKARASIMGEGERRGRQERGGWDRSDPERGSARRARHGASECQTECSWVARPSAQMQKSRGRRAGGPLTGCQKMW